MQKIEVITAWSQTTDEEIGFTTTMPALKEDYSLLRFVDITNMPMENMVPDPNVFVIEAVVDDATLALIEADTKYTVLTVEVY